MVAVFYYNRDWCTRYESYKLIGAFVHPLMYFSFNCKSGPASGGHNTLRLIVFITQEKNQAAKFSADNYRDGEVVSLETNSSGGGQTLRTENFHNIPRWRGPDDRIADCINWGWIEIMLPASIAPIIF